VPNLLDVLRGATSSMPNLINTVVPATPRRRADVAVHDGYAVADAWVKAKPAVFVAGLAGMALSLGALYLRRGKGVESIAMYAGTFAASAGVAWVARPGANGAVSPGASPNTDKVLAWLDARAAKLDKTEPGWQELAERRMLS